MQRKINKKGLKFISILLAILLMIVASLVLFRGGERSLTVAFLDVGQGDAIYIRTPAGEDILIDAGPTRQIAYGLGERMPFWDRTIEHLIITHPHADHYFGLPAVLSRYQVGVIYHSGVKAKDKKYTELVKELAEGGQKFEIIDRPLVIYQENDLVFESIYPFQSWQGKKIEDLNNASIVNKLTYGHHEFLLTGDATEITEEIILERAEENGLDIDVDFLKVGHHGSKYSSTKEFLREVSPQVAIIQSGEGNCFNHPEFQTIHRLKTMGIEVMRNDQLGEIAVVCDLEICQWP